MCSELYVDVERTDIGGMWAEPILLIRCFGNSGLEVVFHLAEFPADKELNIQFVKSERPGGGRGQAALRRLIDWAETEYPGWAVVSSTPIHPAWEHICKKVGLKVYM